jgi:hypothetical protein
MDSSSIKVYALLDFGVLSSLHASLIKTSQTAITGLSSVRTSDRRGCGCIGLQRPPADVRQMTCRPPLHPAVGFGGQHGGQPFRSTIGMRTAAPSGNRGGGRGTTPSAIQPANRHLDRQTERPSASQPSVKAGDQWSEWPSAKADHWIEWQSQTCIRTRSRSDVFNGCLLDAIFPKDVQSNNSMP